MTCIAVVRHEDKIYMAGDRGASDDGTILALDAPKVWKIGLAQWMEKEFVIILSQLFQTLKT